MIYIKYVIFFISLGFSQDERTFRLMLSKGRHKETPKSAKFKKEAKFKHRSPNYQLDLNNDGVRESLFVSKIDGKDLITIRDHKKKLILEEELFPLGPLSRIFKVQMRKTSKDLNTLLIYYYEGTSKYLEFQGTARLYLLTYSPKTFKFYPLYKGPYIWDEHLDFKKNYHQRKQEISLVDFNRDGTREIAVRFSKITRVYYFSKEKGWVGSKKSTF